jgi:16S rRNA (cytosine1407-C5)-methyltransferase
MLKPAFQSRYKDLLGDDYNLFVDYSSRYIRKSIRVNTLKSDINDIKRRLSDFWVLEQVPWCNEGFWITYKEGKRFDIGIFLSTS